MDSLEALADALLPVAIFVFLAIAVWRDRRAKEHEVTERHATYRKVVESGSADRVIELMEHDRRHSLQRQARDKQLGGMIVTAIGVIAMIALYLIGPEDEPGPTVAGTIWVLGFFPLVIGLLLLVHARALRADSARSSGSLPPGR